jgi:Predicted metal-binding integral membrane protein (DUF2182)
MALLFVGGVMNVLWIATISAFVLIEKIAPVGRLISRVAGGGFVAAGAWLVVGSSWIGCRGVTSGSSYCGLQPRSQRPRRP